MTQGLGFEVKLPVAYPEGLVRAREALQAEGFGVLTTIDMRSALAEKLGEAFRPYAILGACNPALAHRALQESAEVGLLLPCNVTVEAAADGGTIVRLADPEMMMRVGDLGGNPAIAAVAREARGRLARVAETLGAG